MIEQLHEAIQGSVADGQLVVRWIAVVDVLGADGKRSLVFRDGPTRTQQWDVLGMLHAGVFVVEETLAQNMNEGGHYPDPNAA